MVSVSSALVGPTFSSMEAFGQTCGVFNVVLHGLFVIDIATGYVQISSPDCRLYKHSYLAGSWNNSFSSFKRVQGEHEPIWPAPIVDPLIRDVPILSSDKVGKPDHSQAYLSLILPAPNAITGLRTFDMTEMIFPADYMKATKFPLVTVLTYNSPPPFAPISGTPWDSKNYHVFAEPASAMGCEEAATHGAQVIQQLWKMFDKKPVIDFKLKNSNNCKKSRDAQPRVRCVTSDEERALSELTGVMNNLDSVHMPTCAVFIAP
jgi:hypothetical protein